MPYVEKGENSKSNMQFQKSEQEIMQGNSETALLHELSQGFLLQDTLLIEIEKLADGHTKTDLLRQHDLLKQHGKLIERIQDKIRRDRTRNPIEKIHLLFKRATPSGKALLETFDKIDEILRGSSNETKSNLFSSSSNTLSGIEQAMVQTMAAKLGADKQLTPSDLMTSESSARAVLHLVENYSGLLNKEQLGQDINSLKTVADERFSSDTLSSFKLMGEVSKQLPLARRVFDDNVEKMLPKELVLAIDETRFEG